MLPARSVCDAVIFFAPSGAENVMSVENMPSEQVVVLGAFTLPDIETMSPFSQVPEMVILPDVIVPAAGLVIATVGGVLSRVKFLLAVPVLPARSVCLAIIFLTPSPAVNVMATEYALAVQVVVAGLESPVPDKRTVSPVSQALESVTPVCATVFAAGDEIVITGAVPS